MKTCPGCGEDIDHTPDGVNLCARCEERGLHISQRSAKARQRRRERESVMRDLGLTKARGALGGTYWE